MVYKWLAIFLAFSLFSDILLRILYFLGINPNLYGNVYQVLSMPLIAIFFYYAIQWPSLKKWLIVINILYFIFCVYNLFFLQKPETINSYSQIFESIIILVLCILFFFKLLKELPARQIQMVPLFWIMSGFLFSYAGKLVIYAITHYAINILNDPLLIIYMFHNLLTLLGYVLITIGAWVYNKYEVNVPPNAI